MFAPRIRSALIVLAGSVALTGCAYGPYGGISAGYGSPYYGSGYSTPYYGSGYGSPYYSAGYGSPYYGSGYGSPYYGGYGNPYGYGYGYGAPSYYGWYNDLYYPGTGYYVYTRDGSRHRWSDAQRRYWESRRVANVTPRENWDGFRRERTQVQQVVSSPVRTRVVNDRRATNDRREAAIQRHAERSQARTERVQTRRATQADARAERRDSSETKASDRRKRRNDD